MSQLRNSAFSEAQASGLGVQPYSMKLAVAPLSFGKNWFVGELRSVASRVGGVAYPAGVVKGVEDQANTGAKHFTLRLTCVVEGDRVLSIPEG